MDNNQTNSGSQACQAHLECREHPECRAVQARRPFRPLTNQRGVALLIALFSMMVMMIIAVEVSFDTDVDYQSSAQAVNRLKAYYAARAGIEMGLLRIKIYETVAAQLGSNSQVPLSMLDPIWQIPFTWPPVLPKEISKAEQSDIQETVAKSAMQAEYVSRIESEGGKLNINDLGSPSTSLAQSTRTQILKIFQNQIIQDENFAHQYRDYDFGRLVNFITDWITPGTVSLNGGDKASYYTDMNTENNPFIPPQQSFKTIDELHMVRDMNDDFYNLLAPRITIYGDEGININYAEKDMLMSLDPQITSEIADAIIAYRQDPGPFTSKDDFMAFLRSKNVNTTNLESSDAIPMLFGAEFNFRITSTATFGKSSREIVAVVYDINQVQQRLTSLLTSDAKTNSPGTNSANPNTPSNPGPTAPPTTNQQSNVQPGPPNVVYWQED